MLEGNHIIIFSVKEVEKILAIIDKGATNLTPNEFKVIEELRTVLKHYSKEK